MLLTDTRLYVRSRKPIVRARRRSAEIRAAKAKVQRAAKVRRVAGRRSLARSLARSVARSVSAWRTPGGDDCGASCGGPLSHQRQRQAVSSADPVRRWSEQLPGSRRLRHHSRSDETTAAHTETPQVRQILDVLLPVLHTPVTLINISYFLILAPSVLYDIFNYFVK